MTFNRLEKIKNELIDKKYLSFSDLGELFPDVSGMTLRRDIDKLEKAGFVTKIRGGARINENNLYTNEDIYSLRAARNLSSKKYVANKALKFIETGRSVYLDSGTTVMELARILPDMHLSIITSGPNIALEIAKRNNPSVNIIGGTLNSNNCSVAGSIALSNIKHYNFDIAFMAPSGYSDNFGFTIGNSDEGEVKKSIIKKSNKVIMLMTKDKLGKILPITFAGLKDIDVIITDAELSNDFILNAEKFNVEILNI